jgi:hypothetical protein
MGGVFRKPLAVLGDSELERPITRSWGDPISDLLLLATSCCRARQAAAAALAHAASGRATGVAGDHTGRVLVGCSWRRVPAGIGILERLPQPLAQAAHVSLLDRPLRELADGPAAAMVADPTCRNSSSVFGCRAERQQRARRAGGPAALSAGSAARYAFRLTKDRRRRNFSGAKPIWGIPVDMKSHSGLRIGLAASWPAHSRRPCCSF